MNRRQFLGLSSALGAATVLSSCGSSEPDERRFANQPMPTEDLGGLGQTPTAGAAKPTATLAATTSPDVLFRVTGSVARIIAADQSAFWSISVDGASASRFGAIPAGASAGVSAMPDASKIGTLISKPDGSEILTIADSRGSELRRLSTPARKGASGGPNRAPRGRLAWDAAGKQLLYAKSSGGIEAVKESGDPVELVTSKQALNPGSVAWSPAGDAIAFVSRAKSSASDAIFAGSTSSLPVDAASVVPANASGQLAIPELAWLNDRMRILYTERSVDSKETFTGDLFDVLASGGDSKLLISAGLAAPISAIGVFSVSPGSEAIAFTVLAPNDAAIAFHSLWVKQLNGGATVRLDVSPNAAVSDLWWTTMGLAWREDSGTLDPTKTGGAFQLRRLLPDGRSVTFFSSQSAKPGTPVASPAAASPIAGSPVASPVPSPKPVP